MRYLLLLGLFAAFTGCGGGRRSNVDRIEVSPAPHGPTLTAWRGSAAERTLLDKVAPLVPVSLPPNPKQECHLGTTITITVRGRSRRYGPCAWPASVERVRRALIAAAGQTDAHGAGRRAGDGWRGVLNDWYDGRMDRWHSCAAVLAALRHLPSDSLTYSTIEPDLRAYARGVCVHVLS